MLHLLDLIHLFKTVVDWLICAMAICGALLYLTRCALKNNLLTSSLVHLHLLLSALPDMFFFYTFVEKKNKLENYLKLTDKGNISEWLKLHLAGKNFISQYCLYFSNVCSFKGLNNFAHRLVNFPIHVSMWVNHAHFWKNWTESRI